MVLGYDFTANHVFPVYSLIRKIKIGDLRVEVVISGIMLIGGFFKAVICFYASNLMLAQIVRAKDYRPFAWPLALILVALSIIIYPNITYTQIFLAKIWTSFALPFGLFLPLLLLGASYIRNRKQNAR